MQEAPRSATDSLEANNERQYVAAGRICAALFVLTLLDSAIRVFTRDRISVSFAASVGLAFAVASAALFAAGKRCRTWDDPASSKGSHRSRIGRSSRSHRRIRSSSSAGESFSDRNTLRIVMLLTLLAIVPRLLVLRFSLWYDELWTIGFMRYGPAYALTHQAGFNNHPLNSLLGSIVVSVWKVAAGPLGSRGIPPAWLVRLPAFTFGVAAVPILYLACRNRLGNRTAIIAAVLLSVCPAAVDYSGQARGYSALLCISIIQVWCLIEALESSSAGWWLGWMTASVLGIMAHLYFVSILVAELIFVVVLVGLLAKRLSTRIRIGPILEQAALIGTAMAALGFASNAGVLPGYVASFKSSTAAAPVSTVSDILFPTLQTWCGVGYGTFYVLTIAFACVLFVCSIVRLWQKAPAALCLFGLLVVVPVAAAAAVQPRFLYMRFFAFLVPVFVVLMAAGIREMLGWLPGPSSRHSAGWSIVLGSITAVYVCMGIPGLLNVLELPKQDYQGAAELAQLDLRNGRTVVAIGPGAEYFEDYDARLGQPLGVADLQKLLASQKYVTVVDTRLQLGEDEDPTDLESFVLQLAGAPMTTFPARYSGWEYRYLDGDSDMAVYRIQRARTGPGAGLSSAK